MLWLRQCPRCGGDLHDLSFGGDTWVSCLQCGGILSAEAEDALRGARKDQTRKVGAA